MKQVNNFIVLVFLLFCISGFSQDQDIDTTTEDNPVSKGTIFLSKDISIDTGIRYDKGDSKSESRSGNELESSFSALNLVGGISIYL